MQIHCDLITAELGGNYSDNDLKVLCNSKRSNLKTLVQVSTRPTNPCRIAICQHKQAVNNKKL